MPINRPSYTVMRHQFALIYGDGQLATVGNKIGGKVKENIDLGKKDPLHGFTNACTIRMSYALNHSGIIVHSGA